MLIQKQIQQINFTENLDRVGQTAMYFITEEAKYTVLYFNEELSEYCNFILFYIILVQNDSL